MKPLIVLIAVFFIALMIIKITGNNFEFAPAARIAMSAMLLFTAVAHFAFTKGMMMMVPVFIPLKKQVVYLTGIIEIAAAAGLQVPAVRVLTGWLLILFFALMLPANINAAIRHIDYQKGTADGSGVNYLWFRVPLQIFFIAWVFLSAIKF